MVPTLGSSFTTALTTTNSSTAKAPPTLTRKSVRLPGEVARTLERITTAFLLQQRDKATNATGRIFESDTAHPLGRVLMSESDFHDIYAARDPYLLALSDMEEEERQEFMSGVYDRSKLAIAHMLTEQMSPDLCAMIESQAKITSPELIGYVGGALPLEILLDALKAELDFKTMDSVVTAMDEFARFPPPDADKLISDVFTHIKFSRVREILTDAELYVVARALYSIRHYPDRYGSISTLFGAMSPEKCKENKQELFTQIEEADNRFRAQQRQVVTRALAAEAEKPCVECSYCGKPGHTEAKCFKKAKDEKKQAADPKGSSSIADGMLTVRINKKK